MRPAINVGISVSRVGGNAQIKAMKQVAGRLRIELAQYRELAAFAKFGSDLDAATQKQLRRGERLVEVLKQGQYVPLPVEEQVLQIFAATEGFWDDVPVADVVRMSDELLDHMRVSQSAILSEIVAKKELSDDLRARMRKAIQEFKEAQLAVSAKA